jgi:hypothetical protein
MDPLMSRFSKPYSIDGQATCERLDAIIEQLGQIVKAIESKNQPPFMGRACACSPGQVCLFDGCPKFWKIIT